MPASPVRVFAAISALQQPERPSPVIGKAVVVGGSVAGLLAARVLSDHADSVVIIDWDDLHGTGPRPGVPQSTQLHALLPGGFLQLERLFPGFNQQALALGAVALPPASRLTYVDGRPKVVVPDETDGLAGSRPFLEGLVGRQRAADQILDATVTDVKTARVFNEVVSMLRHPSALAKPSVVLRSLRVNRRAR